VIVNNSTNINKWTTRSHLNSPNTKKKDHNILLWKSR